MPLCLHPQTQNCMKRNAKFESGLYYHEIIKANSDSILFRDSDDKKFFLKKMCTFILPCCEILAYCILGNHVHLLLKPHPKEILSKLTLNLHLLDSKLKASDLQDYLDHKIEMKLPLGEKNTSVSVHEQIRSCLKSLKRSYDHYLLKKYNASGYLWSRYKSTTLLPYPEDISRTIIYIHKNPVYHGMVHHPEDWSYTSIHEILAQQDKLVRSNEVIRWFGSISEFRACHAVTQTEFGKKPAKLKSTLNTPL